MLCFPLFGESSMKKLLSLLFVIYSFYHLEALNRDYRVETGVNKQDCNPFCFYHACAKWPFPNGVLDVSIFYDLPNVAKKCVNCESKDKRPAIYSGYVDLPLRKYLGHLEKQANFYILFNCPCLWPECSEKAAQISDKAYLLFNDLILTTQLSELLENKKAQKKFIKNEGIHLNEHLLTISFIAHQFRFTDYYHVCRDIEEYSQSKYDELEFARIKDKLDNILETLHPLFFSLYESCLAKHPTKQIKQEVRFLKLLIGDISGLEASTCLIDDAYQNYPNEDIPNNDTNFEFSIEQNTENLDLEKNINESINADKDSFILIDEILLEQGSLLNDLLSYKAAIEVLTKLIKSNPKCRNAYIERASAYFELNEISLALQDYYHAKKLTVTAPFKRTIALDAIYIPDHKNDFCEGLILGTLEGGKISAEEFFPSVLSCCRGLLNGLWAFVLNPKDLSLEMVNSAYSMGEYISSHTTIECLECFIPELQDLSLTWNKINDYSKGKKIGYMIGKYGVEIFAPIGVIKGTNKFRTLKRANTMCTLESCAISQVNKTKILEEGAKRSAIRESLIVEVQKSGKIYPKNANAVPHILQDKHAWEKIVDIKMPIKIKGNLEENFASVIHLLEKEQLLSQKYFTETLFSKGCLKVNKHTKIINGHKVEAIFEINSETNLSLLQDAWVVTK